MSGQFEKFEMQQQWQWPRSCHGKEVACGVASGVSQGCSDMPQEKKRKTDSGWEQGMSDMVKKKVMTKKEFLELQDRIAHRRKHND